MVAKGESLLTPLQAASKEPVRSGIRMNSVFTAHHTMNDTMLG
ncbi:hypothetical protein Y695_02973 [Hydrogenophaga sp. T4]|nr:hypothetical protein Y695_02973 [Hydrogenophaga sp. T4]